MSYVMTVRQLKQQLNMYDDDAVVMIGEDRDSAECVEASPYTSYAHRTDDGEIVSEVDLTNDDSFATMEKVVIIWGLEN